MKPNNRIYAKIALGYLLSVIRNGSYQKFVLINCHCEKPCDEVILSAVAGHPELIEGSFDFARDDALHRIALLRSQ
jgi:hypothetical protein